MPGKPVNRFLDNLAVRLHNPAAAIQPRAPSRFELEAAASPRPFFAPETVWEETEGLEDGPPQAPETERPEHGSPRRPLARRSPAGPLPTAALLDAAAPSALPPPAAWRVGADGPPAPAQAARPSVPSDAPAPRPPDPSAPPVSPAQQAPDEKPPVGVTPRARPMTSTGSPVAEAAAMPAPAPRPLIEANRDVPVPQASESLAPTERAHPGPSAPLSPPLTSDPARVSAPAASAEAAMSPRRAVSVETVTAESEDAPTLSETPGRRPAVIVRAAPAPPPAARPSEPVARETPPPAPTIQVTIGRIEVRAAAPAPRAASARPTPPKLTLEEYLRDGGRR